MDQRTAEWLSQGEFDLGKFLVKLNEANIATRYPESLENLMKIYTKPITFEIITNTKEAFQWIRNQLSTS